MARRLSWTVPVPDGTFAAVVGSPFSASVPGGRIAGWQQGSGEPVLLIHGGPALDCSYTSELVDELARSHHVATYQQRGIEPSTTEGPFTVGREVEDLLAVLDELAWDRAWLVGHSFGGIILLLAMVAAPDRVLGGLGVDPLGAVGDGGWDALGKALQARIPGDAWQRSEDIDARVMAGTASDDEHRESWRIMWPAYFAEPEHAPPFPEGLRVSTAAYAGVTASLGPELPALAAALPEIRAPFGCVTGEKSPLPHDLAGGATAKAIPGGWCEVVEGAGHAPWVERPGSVASALQRLIDAG
jgi:pimeloyl-ACP methyl ester carboxylesterase